MTSITTLASIKDQMPNKTLTKLQPGKRPNFGFLVEIKTQIYTNAKAVHAPYAPAQAGALSAVTTQAQFNALLGPGVNHVTPPDPGTLDHQQAPPHKQLTSGGEMHMSKPKTILTSTPSPKRLSMT